MFISAAFGAVVGVAHSALEHLATLLTPLAGGFAGALAIVVFTLLVRLLISPLTYLQVRAERRRTALAPQLEELRRKHKDDRVALATETLAVQRAAGVGPFVSLLPGLAQAPFFMIMFRLVHPAAAVVTGLLAGALLGVPLTAHAFTSAPGLAIFAALLSLGVVLAWWNSRRMRRLQAASVDNAAKLSDPRATLAPPSRGRGGSGPTGTATSSAVDNARKVSDPGAKVTPPHRGRAADAREINAAATARKPAVGQKPTGAQKAAVQKAVTQKPAAVQKAVTQKQAAVQKAVTQKPAAVQKRPGGPKAPPSSKPTATRSTTTPAAPPSTEGIAAGMARIMPWMPYLTVAVMAYLPLAGAIYLLTSTAWTALEHAMWRRPITMSNQ